MKKEEETTYLREMNGASLMLEVEEGLECGEDVVPNQETDSVTREIPPFEVLEILLTYGPLVDGRTVSLDCEPGPFNYRVVDGEPDQKQSHLPTKIAASIEFRMNMNAHACIQRRAERDSVPMKQRGEIPFWVVLQILDHQLQTRPSRLLATVRNN